MELVPFKQPRPHLDRTHFRAPYDTMNSAGNWQLETIGGHPADIYLPTEPNPHGYVLVYLHGLHQQRLVDKQPFIDQLEKHGLPVVAPHTKRSWWADRTCREFDPKLTARQHLLQNVIPYIEQRWNTTSPQIGLLGTSMGGQGALMLSYLYPDKFPVVAAISPAIDNYKRYYDDGYETLPEMYDEPEAVRQDSAVLHIHPLNWPRHQFFCCDPADYAYFDGVDRLRMKLYSLGVPFESDFDTSGGGHGFEYYNLMAEQAIGFVAHALERERLRVT